MIRRAERLLNHPKIYEIQRVRDFVEGNRIDMFTLHPKKLVVLAKADGVSISEKAMRKLQADLRREVVGEYLELRKKGGQHLKK